ncbi:histidinol dehydrogenase [Luteimonas sp. MJ174]|uniref:histidinol dehydrogenase n=1 Tax=Luteimonas sp. MJ174 TaxID=3129237 RepID=UPI0031BA48DD
MKRLDWSALDARGRAEALRRPVQDTAADVTATVAGIIDAVVDGGDAAVRELGRGFDGVGLDDARVGADAFDAAMAAVPPALLDALRAAASRIEAFHRAGMQLDYAVETAPGVRCARMARPIRRVGLYVPAGSAPLPSTVLMLGVPAQLAGCTEVVMCTPPRADGSVDPVVLAAARLCGITRVYRVGGAQAIAAMACGTASIPACDKLFGPGNAWVTEAKRQVAQRGLASIDMPAGPSEVLVVADAGANPGWVAADLLSQAEHGPDSQVLLVSDSDALLDAVADAIAAQLERLPRAAVARTALSRSRLLRVDGLAQAFEVSNAYAPEHLILALREPRAWLGRVQVAGSVFLGDHTPEALGDYCSGTNHVLPTAGAAAANSGVSVSSFQNFISVQEATAEGIAAIGPDALAMARAEGLEAHASAVRLRLEQAA